MTRTLTASYLQSLVQELRSLPNETDWVEFKENNDDPDKIGEYISALSNSAALAGKTFGYLLWGIRDSDHEIVGTSFQPSNAKVGQEELESWLLRLLTPKIHFRFYSIAVESKELVLLEIQVAYRHPVQFKGQEFIRVGSYKKKLKDYPEKESLIHHDDGGSWGVTNLGAILFAKHLRDFGALGRKALRVIRYRGDSRIETIRELEIRQGYASAFESLANQIIGQVPSREIIEHSLRKEVGAYPELAVRELVANALIHQLMKYVPYWVAEDVQFR